MAEGKTIAILISNGTYPNWGDTQAAEHDPTIKNAKASHHEFKKIISDLHYFGSDESPIQLIEFEDKESSEIRKAIQRATKDCKAADTLYLYYVGHGLKKTDGNLYLTTVDTEYNYVETSSISSSDMRKLLDDCQAGRKIVILDCCFAGYFLSGTQDADWNSQHIQEMQEMKGTFYMFSSPSGKRSKFKKDDETLATYFTLAMVEAIKEGDQSGGQYFTALEVLDLIEKKIDVLRVEEEDPEIPDPDKAIRKNAEKFPFCKNARYVPSLSEEDKELNDLITNPVRGSVRSWQKKYPGSKRQEESRNLLRKIENTETEIEEVLKIPPKERKKTLLDLADKFPEWKDMYELVMDLYDAAVDEARLSYATSPLAKVEGTPVEKVSGDKAVITQPKTEENKKAHSPDDNLPGMEAASIEQEQDKTPNTAVINKETKTESPGDQNPRSAVEKP